MTPIIRVMACCEKCEAEQEFIVESNKSKLKAFCKTCASVRQFKPNLNTSTLDYVDGNAYLKNGITFLQG
jgi:hypothetical protein